PCYEMSGWILEANALFLSYLFETFGFHKIYFEMIEFNYHKLASGAGTIFHVEGCFADHEHHLGRRWNLYTLAIYREEWSNTLARLAPHLADRPDRGTPGGPLWNCARRVPPRRPATVSRPRSLASPAPAGAAVCAALSP